MQSNLWKPNNQKITVIILIITHTLIIAHPLLFNRKICNFGPKMAEHAASKNRPSPSTSSHRRVVDTKIWNLIDQLNRLPKLKQRTRTLQSMPTFRISNKVSFLMIFNHRRQTPVSTLLSTEWILSKVLRGYASNKYTVPTLKKEVSLVNAPGIISIITVNRKNWNALNTHPETIC